MRLRMLTMLAALLSTGSIFAQTPPPGPAPAPRIEGMDPRMREALEAQRAGFEARQRCVAAHDREYRLHSASTQLVRLREQRAATEYLFATKPDLRAQYPGGYDEMMAKAFEYYRSMGGTAASPNLVTASPDPCPIPALPMGPDRAGTKGSVSQSRSITIDAAPR